MQSGNFITTTELRTKSKKLVETLKNGGSLSLVHRSKVIGKIKPYIHEAPPIKDINAFMKTLDGLIPGKIIPRKDREKVYRKRLMEKYGKGLS